MSEHYCSYKDGMCELDVDEAFKQGRADAIDEYDWIKEQYSNSNFKEKKEKIRLVLTRKRKKKMLKIIRHMYQVMSEVEDYTMYAGIMNSLVLLEEELTGVSSDEILEKLPKKHNIKEVDFT